VFEQSVMEIFGLRLYEVRADWGKWHSVESNSIGLIKYDLKEMW
jgi:hypothetical protein